MNRKKREEDFMRFKKGRKGFTLVELIVVLVILAILAALLVPALTGYIDKAKEKSVVAEARMILQAVQTEVSEIYGTSDWKQIGSAGTIASADGTIIAGDPLGEEWKEKRKSRYKDIVDLAEVPSLSDGTGKFMAGILATGKVRILVYNDGKGNICLYHVDTNRYEVLKTSKVSDEAINYCYNKVFMTIEGTQKDGIDWWSYEIFTSHILQPRG